MSHIILGGVKHALTAPTIGSQEALQNALKAEHASWVAQTVAVLNTHLAVPVDNATPARVDELRQAFRDLLTFVGFKEGEPGESAAPASGA